MRSKPLIAVAAMAVVAVVASAQPTLADGEVRKVDLAQGKLTLKHGPIPNLEMPGMTMVFKVVDPRLLAGLKEGDKVRFGAERVNGAIVVTTIEAAARADLVDIRWDAELRFRHAQPIAPGKFAEVCGKLAAGEQVAWQFEASGPTQFNIHYHEGKQVVFPAKRDDVSTASGTLPVERAQDYCWMWTNKGTQPVTLSMSLSKAR